METILNYLIIVGNIIWENWFFIFAIIYGILMIYFQTKYYKERNENIRLKSKIAAHGFVISITSGIITKFIKENNEIRKENNKNIELLKSARTSRNNYQTKVARYKKFFYAYDFARRGYFGKSAAGKVFYKSYTKASNMTMKFLNKSFIDSRNNLQ